MPDPTPTPTPTFDPNCDLPCFNINLTKIEVDTWQGVYNDIVITFLFNEEDLIISNEDGIEFWNKTISNWKNYIVDGILTLPYCQNIKIGGFCNSYLRKCVEISDQGFTLGGQNGSKRRYSWNSSDGFYYDNNTPVVNSPWTINGNVLRIDFEDDGNCKKYNSFVQTSTCRFFYNSNEETEATISWTGKGEVQDPCYDIMNIRINGSLVAYAHAPGGGNGCNGVGDVISYPNSPYTTTLSKGSNIIEISVTTRDPLYHSGAYYEFTITPFSCCNCNLKILNVTEKEILEDGSKVYEVSLEKNNGNCCNIEYKLSNGEWTNIPSENLDCSQLVSDGKILVTMLQSWMDCNATPLPTATPTPTPTPAVYPSNLWAWGINYGGFGNGQYPPSISYTPVNIGSSNWKIILGSQFLTLGIKNDGTLWGWGSYNNEIILGTSEYVPTPIQIGTDSDWDGIYGSGWNLHLIKVDGTLWGNSFPGINSLNFPVQLGTDTWKYVCSIDNYALQDGTSTFAIKTDNTLWSWGPESISIGQVGSDTWKVVEAGPNYVVGIKSDDTLWAWGHNEYGQLGDGTQEYRSNPTQIGSTTWKTIALPKNWSSMDTLEQGVLTTFGGPHTLGIMMDGTLWSWGSNHEGQLGNGSSCWQCNFALTQLYPIQIGSNTWKSIACGNERSFGIKEDGTLWAWGYNYYYGGNIGILGVEGIPTRNTPGQIGTDNDWDKVFASSTNVYALKNT